MFKMYLTFLYYVCIYYEIKGVGGMGEEGRGRGAWGKYAIA
jgi:hypothetical protein